MKKCNTPMKKTGGALPERWIAEMLRVRYDNE